MKHYIATLLIAFSVFAAMDSSAGGKQLQLNIKPQDVDLANRTIHFTINKGASTAHIKVYDLDGNVLSEKTRLFDGEKAGTKLSITWPTIPGDEQNFRIEMKVTDVNEYWVGFEIVRFYGDIPHEEVIFESGKWDIRPEEAPKLDTVIPEIKKMVEKFQRFSSKMTYALYIAGHTDTVGSPGDNQKLSEKRANAIATYLKKNGLKKLKINIFVRGFGESAPAVKTADNTAEEKNRRADYIISNFPPQMAGSGVWKKMK